MIAQVVMFFLYAAGISMAVVLLGLGAGIILGLK